jgi:hypothetical protein
MDFIFTNLAIAPLLMAALLVGILTQIISHMAQ